VLNWSGSFRFHEAVIASGDPVSVIGAGVRELDVPVPDASGYRGAPPARLRVAGSADASLAILCGPQP